MSEFVKDPRIVCAAIKLGQDIICGPRHYDSTMHAHIAREGKQKWYDGKHLVIQGFVDQYGDFHDRMQAFVIACNNNQIRRKIPGPEGMLFSEHLY